MTIKNNKLFQACMPLALVLTFFCTPVFSLVSHIDTDQFTTTLSTTYSASYSVSNCFDGVFGTDCASMNDSNLSIVFNEPVNIFDFHISPSLASSIGYDYFSADGVIYQFATFYDTFSLENVTNIIIYSRSDSLIYFSEISFNFETVVVTGGGTDDDFRCKGFSCWFLSEQDYKNVWIALLTFMVSVFALAYLGKIIRTGGQS